MTALLYGIYTLILACIPYSDTKPSTTVQGTISMLQDTIKLTGCCQIITHPHGDM